MTGWTMPGGRAELPGRHVDAPAAETWLVRRLNPTAFAQTMLVICLALVLWPATFGGRFGIVMVAGTSMEPTYVLGDAVITWQQPVEIGDVILYRVPEGDFGAGNPVIHRVVGGSRSGWVTQGDNSKAPDEWVPANSEVLGVARFHIPFGGRVLAVMRSWLFIALMGGVATGLLLWPDARDDEQVDPRSIRTRSTRRGRHAPGRRLA